MKDQETSEGLDQKKLYEEIEIIVDPKQSPIRIDKFLTDKLADVSRTKIQNAISFGAVRVDFEEIKSNHKVQPGEKITLVIPKNPLAKDYIVPEEIPLNIHYEDDDLLVINKQAGLVMHPGVGNYTGTLVNALAFYYQEKKLPIKEGNFNDRPGLVHRIDKDTSGLIVVAKTEAAMSSLSKQFFDHTIERKYKALVWSSFDEKSGTIDEFIGRNPRNRIQMMVFKDRDMGKHAITHWRVLEDFYYVTLIECQLETGRTHQIRAHMKHAGHPLFNDERYGGHKVLKGTVFSKYKTFVENCFKLCPRQALHAYSLGFTHPTTGEKVLFEADPPEDMSSCILKWRDYVQYRKETV